MAADSFTDVGFTDDSFTHDRILDGSFTGDGFTRDQSLCGVSRITPGRVSSPPLIAGKLVD